MPIIADTDFTSWRNTQTLATGTLPGYTFKRQPGVRPFHLQVLSAGTTAAGVVSVTDPNDSTVLWQAAVGASAGAAGTILIDEEFDDTRMTWRDFSVTGLTTTVTKLVVWYRQ